MIPPAVSCHCHDSEALPYDLADTLYACTPDPTQSIAAQVERLRACLAVQGSTLVDAYVFHGAGFSGQVFERPGLEAMLEALLRGVFVRRVTEHPDTLSRTIADR